MRRTTVTLVVPTLQGGGAERVAVDLAGHWSRQGRAVALVEIDRSETPRFLPPPEVRRLSLGLMATSPSGLRAVHNNLRRLRTLRRAMGELRPEIVVSFVDITNVLVLLACRGTGLPVVVSERTDPRHHRIPRVWDWWRDRTYGGARQLVVQTTAVRQWAESKGWRCPIAVIPNAAPEWAAAPAPDRSDRPVRQVVALGRLSEEKGHAQLIEAFHRIAPGFPDWRLVIYGAGSERARLEKLRRDLGMTGQVALPGWTTDVAAALREADVFVLPSRYEGFPNALLEAMAFGVACISSDCDSGPREIIRHEIDGLLVPPGDTASLEGALVSLMGDVPRRERLAREARSVIQRFSRPEFFRRWDEVLDAD